MSVWIHVCDKRFCSGYHIYIYDTEDITYEAYQILKNKKAKINQIRISNVTYDKEDLDMLISKYSYLDKQVDMNTFFKDAVELQRKYKILERKHNLSKKAMCDLCTPFRDKYSLTDLQVLRIARKEMDLSEMVVIAEKL